MHSRVGRQRQLYIIDMPRLESDQIDDALNELAWDLGGYDDIHASARYRRELVRKQGRDQVERIQNDQDRPGSTLSGEFSPQR